MIEREAYAFSIKHVGLTEIKGDEDNFLIRTAHLLCNPWGLKSARDLDKIPWCSAWVNLAIAVACIQRNPKAAHMMLEKRRLPVEIIKDIFKISEVDYDSRFFETGKEIIAPTYSAAAISWLNWGETVTPENARRGDVVLLTRSEGFHVGFLDEDKVGKIYLTLLGGNQKDQVCSASWFLRARLLSIRRASV